MGFKLSRHTAVGDDLDDLVGLFREIARRSDCCICTGGLGPTLDDLTAEAVSIASGTELQFDSVAMRQIEHYFSRVHRPMPEANRKQAYLPAGAQRIDNSRGTAPGFALRYLRCWFVFLPGVPAEMQTMFADLVKPDLQQRFPLQPDTLMTLRSIGIGESAIQQTLANWVIPPGVKLGFRVTPEEVQTKLLFPAGFSSVSRQHCVEQAASLLGDYVFTIDTPKTPKNDLMAVIARAMHGKQLELSLLETASHGLIAAKCLNQPWLRSAEIALDKRWQNGLLADTAKTLAAQLAADRSDSLALVQLYQQLNDESTDDNQVIVLYNALCTPQGLFCSQHTIAGSGTRKQNQAALLTLDLLRRYLQDKCPYFA